MQACCQSHPDAHDLCEQARHPSTLHLDLAPQTCPVLYPGNTGTPNSNNHNNNRSLRKGHFHIRDSSVHTPHSDLVTATQELYSKHESVSCPLLMLDLKHGPAHSWTLPHKSQRGPLACTYNGWYKNIKARETGPNTCQTPSGMWNTHNGDARPRIPLKTHATILYLRLLSLC